MESENRVVSRIIQLYDTTQPAERPDGAVRTVALENGNESCLRIQSRQILIQVNTARYWKDPHALNPSRFLGRMAYGCLFAPFMRVCIGRGRSDLDAILKMFQVELKNPELYARPTPVERKKSYLQPVRVDNAFAQSSIFAGLPIHCTSYFFKKAIWSMVAIV
ncbi:hypothetical protein BU17DRAFT_60031 [Hysterangium stoloniferum]|nr:hypothetical protein BU17DRAFT_60031 [Hysterangium stoloniferum]